MTALILSYRVDNTVKQEIYYNLHANEMVYFKLDVNLQN